MTSTQAERDYLNDRLMRIEDHARGVLKKCGYPEDAAALGLERHWRRLNRDIKKSRTPYGGGDRARRAVAALLLVQQLREMLETCDTLDTLRAVRYALDLGPLAGDALTDALAIRVNRDKGGAALGRVNQTRRKASADRRAEAQRLDRQILARYRAIEIEIPRAGLRGCA